jgi:hypothetical protein
MTPTRRPPLDVLGALVASIAVVAPDGLPAPKALPADHPEAATRGDA